MLPQLSFQKKQKLALLCLGLLLVLGGTTFLLRPNNDTGPAAPSANPIKPALTVTLTTAQETDWPRLLHVDGNIAAWQESLIGSELPPLRVTEVLAQVGDSVRKGQILARLSDDAATAEREEAQAAVSELGSYADEARANAERARILREQGFYSQQANTQYLTGEQASQARLKAARARLQNAELQLSKTRIVASDDGIISARNATVGSLTQPGHELFRLIRGGRLEWQVELPAEQLALIHPGMAARIDLDTASTEPLEARVRNISPAIDPRTRTGLVYLDTSAHVALRAGMFVRGHIITGQGPVIAIPQRTVVLRDGHTYVFTLSGKPERAQLRAIRTGTRLGDQIEVIEGLAAGDVLVDQGARFLADGDVVQIIPHPSNPAATSNKAAP